MRIGELAERSGVSHRTIHYYESRGLLHPAQREGAGYRYYNEEAQQRLDKISVLKNLGLNLDEIASVINLYFEDDSGVKGKEKVLDILTEQIAQTDARLDELTRFRAELAENIERMKRLIAEAKRRR